MIFGPAPLAEARGTILAHTQRLGGRVIAKGTVLAEAELAALGEAGHEQIVVARLEAGDVPENDVAERIGAALVGPLIARSHAATGRVNLTAESGGLLRVDAAGVHRLNAVDESLTLATLPDAAVVVAHEMLATIKVIPFAVPGRVVAVAEALARRGPLLSLHPFRALRVGLVATDLPGVARATTDGMIAATAARVERLGGTLLAPQHCPHAEGAIAERIRTLLAGGAELVLVAGAAAVVDRRDVGPAGIVRAGGTIEQLGMPVDPGTLLCLGEVGAVPAIVLPACAASPNPNGFDRVLERIFAGVPVTGADLARMGAGGLLPEAGPRPTPRATAAQAPRPARAPRPPASVAAVVLAAGRSRRMAPLNKLLVANTHGVAMIARVVDQVLASRARPVVVVLGHQAREVEAALAGRKVTFVEAPDYADGLSASLKSGIAALPARAEAAMVCLGDMPLVTAAAMDRLIAAFAPGEGRTIIKPTYRGKQGNPMVWGRQYFDEILALGGDVGARHLAAAHADAVTEVEMADDGVLRDFDTTDALAGLPGTGKLPAPRR